MSSADAGEGSNLILFDWWCMAYNMWEHHDFSSIHDADVEWPLVEAMSSFVLMWNIDLCHVLREFNACVVFQYMNSP